MQISLIREIIKEALKEDIGKEDITTGSLLSQENFRRKAKIVAKSEGVLAGIIIAKEVFRILDPETEFAFSSNEGELFYPGDTLLEFEAASQAILEGERTALNFLQKLSGIATLTRKFVDKVSPYGVKILDTRKTTPLLRQLEKYAVRVGGGINHRFGLDSGVLIKDNHIKIVGSIKKAVELVRKKTPPLCKIEVEVTNIDQLREAIESGVDMIMLDNIGYQNLKEAIQIIRSQTKKIIVEVSGGITLENVEKIAKLKPDFISVGKLTYLGVEVDMSLKVI